MCVSLDHILGFYGASYRACVAFTFVGSAIAGAWGGQHASICRSLGYRFICVYTYV